MRVPREHELLGERQPAYRAQNEPSETSLSMAASLDASSWRA